MSRPQRLLIATMTVLAGASRLVALSKFPWDWDEILFCLAVRDYNMQAHQPHPPGFPLYVAMGKIARVFANDDFRALQTVNLLAAVAVFPVAFWLARALRLEFRTACCAALIFAFLPNIWFYGGTAFSDLPAVVLYLAAAAAFLSVPPPAADGESGRKAVRLYAIGSFLLACALLIRPHSVLIALYPWSAATIRLFRAGRIRALLGTAALVVVLVAIGYGAAAWVTGLDEFAATMKMHSRFVRQTDSVYNPTRPPLSKIVRMQLDPYEAGKVSLALNALALVALLFGSRRLAAEVLLTFLPFFGFMAFLLSHVGFSRLAMTYSFGVVLLAAEGMGVLARRLGRGDVPLRIAVTAAIVGRLIVWMLPAFEQPRTTLPPPNAATLWLRDHTSPKDSKIAVHDSMWPWARYYLTDRDWVHVGDDIGIRSESDVRDEWLLKAGPAHSVNSVVFRRPRHRLWNVVAQRYFEAHAQPVSDIVFFGSGWYQIEWDDQQTWRWMGQRSQTLLPPLGGTCELRLRYSVPVDVVGHPIRIELSMNGKPLGSVVATGVDNEARFVTSARGNAPNILRIDVGDTIRAPGDTRPLGLRIWSWGWTRL